MGFSLAGLANPITKLVKDRYTDGGAGINNLDFSNIAKDFGAAAALYGVINPNDSSGLASFFGTGGQQQPVGYTGGIPNYTASRELAPDAFASTYTTPDEKLAARRPGMAGRRYFTDTEFTPSTDEPFMGVTATQIAAQNQAAVDEQALFENILSGVENKRSDNSEGISTREANIVFAALDRNLATPQEVADYYGFTTDEVLKAYRDMGGTKFAQGEDIVGGDGVVINTDFPRLAGGGLASLKSRGYYLGGPTDGMADQIPATIDNMQPAALSDGEFVIPADVVSHLGNGNSDSGAQSLYSMMERVRTDRTGNPEQGREIDPNKYLA